MASRNFLSNSSVVLAMHTSRHGPSVIDAYFDSIQNLMPVLPSFLWVESMPPSKGAERFALSTQFFPVTDINALALKASSDRIFFADQLIFHKILSARIKWRSKILAIFDLSP